MFLIPCLRAGSFPIPETGEFGFCRGPSSPGSGKVNRTRQPAPGWLSTTHAPPTSANRARILLSPSCPAPAGPGANPRPSSSMLTASKAPSHRTRSQTSLAGVFHDVIQRLFRRQEKIVAHPHVQRQVRRAWRDKPKCAATRVGPAPRRAFQPEGENRQAVWCGRAFRGWA